MDSDKTKLPNEGSSPTADWGEDDSPDATAVDEDEGLEVEEPKPTQVTLDSRWLWGLLVLAIVAVAAALRLYDLARQSMWLDELFTANVVGGGPQLTLGRIMNGDTNPPLHYLLQSLVSLRWARTEFSLRILPAIFGIMGTAAMYFAGATLFDRKTGAWAAGLFSVSVVAIEFAQEARMYSLMMLCAALVLWALGALIRKPGPVNALLLGVAMALLAYSHVYGYVAAPMLLVAVILVPRLRKRIGWSMLVTYPVLAVLFVPWVFAIPAQIAFVQRQATAGNWWMSTPDDLIGSLVHYVGLYAPGKDVLSGLLFFVLLATGFVQSSNKVTCEASEDGKRSAVTEGDVRWALLALMALPVLAGIVVSYYVTPISTIRNTLVGLPAAYLLAVHGAFKFKKPFGVIALVALVIGAALSLPAYYKSDSKGHWKDALTMWGEEDATGALAEDWTSASNVDSYRTITHSRRQGDMLWLSDAGNSAGLTGQILPDNTKLLLSEWLNRYERVVVISQTEDSWLFKHMDEETGWKPGGVSKFGNPYVHVYVRSAESSATQ
ncbi:MAG TPA: glycosyltransferase family 39 protein [Coriobacteriia bacterium]|nr:glycosyltransferase family 39 protein [Coriobacteriia bacterium]